MNNSFLLFFLLSTSLGKEWQANTETSCSLECLVHYLGLGISRSMLFVEYLSSYRCLRSSLELLVVGSS